ncbi:MAG: methyltransferase domain-containing protein [Verrucomicrobia bacterium]|nr:methyltransferase domain-containing protein [Verrucomicrobiota bacterium]
MRAQYILGTDSAAAQRLRVLDEVYHQTTVTLLERAGLREGWRCADIGCGTGLVALTMAKHVGPAGRVIGVDEAGTFVDVARQSAANRKLKNTEFVSGDAYLPPLPHAQFDLVYARCLLSHLDEPLRALHAMTALARPGGCVVIDDIDCGGVFAHPETPVLMRHLDLYQRAVRLNGGDPLMGRKLPRLCRKTGLTDVRYEIVRPAEPTKAVKRLYPLTLACLRPAIVEAKLATADEVDALVATLNAMADDPTATVSSCPMVQVWARKS